MTLTDSFLKNKIGTGNGEAKYYIGYNNRFMDFFDSIDGDFFFLKEDFEKYILDVKEEFYDPQQDYEIRKKELVKEDFQDPKQYDELIKKAKERSSGRVRKKDFQDPKQYDELIKKVMVKRYDDLLEEFNSYENGFLKFELKRIGVKPPRVYLKSESKYYEFMRGIGVPNISYLSIMKLKVPGGSTVYYCRMFIDYRHDIIKYESPMEKKEEEKILSSNLDDKSKANLMNARRGQGKYRLKLLNECPICPFTSVSDDRILIASHIKPWGESDDKEKLDPKNGFMFTPTYDKLFDKGFITFDSDKKLRVSPWISKLNQKNLKIYDGKVLDKLPLDEKREKYMQYHRKNIFNE